MSTNQHVDRIVPSLPRVSDYVAWYAERTPHAEATVLGATRTTYRELHEHVEALARALIAAGVQKGDRVATLCTPHPDYFVAFLATSSIGAIWVGLNPRYRLDELAYVLQDAEPVLLLTRTRIGARDYTAELARLRCAAPSLRQVIVLEGDPPCAGADTYQSFVDSGAQFPRSELDARRAACGGRDPCLIVYTSGSTGHPKGAVLTHQGIAEVSLAQDRVWPVSRVCFVNYFPINHVGCVGDVSCPTLVAGGCIVFLEQFDPAAALRLMETERATVWGSVPTVFQMQLALPDFSAFDLSSVELVIWEGAAMPEELIRRLLCICPRLATNYSLTETTGAVTVVAPTDDVNLLAQSVGMPFEGVEVRLADAEGHAVEAGAEGEIQARSPYNMLGYWRREAETAAALLPGGWLRTGDVGVRRPDGSYRIVGRLKEMYKSGGYNVYPREVERAIETHPAVEMAAVIGVPDPLWQEVGIAYVVPRSGVEPAELERHCRQHLANYKVPKRFVLRRALPLLPIGKVDKIALRREAEAGAGQGRSD